MCDKVLSPARVQHTLGSRTGVRFGLASMDVCDVEQRRVKWMFVYSMQLGQHSTVQTVQGLDRRALRFRVGVFFFR